MSKNQKSVPIFFLLLIFTFLNVCGEEKKAEKIYIPPVVKKVMAESVQNNQMREDIKFSIDRCYYLPAQNQYFIIFVFKARNAELGYLHPQVAADQKTGNQQQTLAEGNQLLKTGLNVFFWFFQKQNEKILPFKEQYVPTKLEIPAEGYDPEKVETYTVATILPAGDYRFCMAITSLDLKKIGVINFDFKLPEISKFEGKPQISPLIFVDNLEELSEPEVPPVVHRGFFQYTALKVFPRLNNRFKVGEIPDLLYFIFGCKTKEDGRSFDLEIKYTVKKADGSIAIEFAEMNFNFPFISHKLPLQKEGGVNLEPGNYTVEIVIKDNVAKAKSKNSFDLILE